MKTTNQFRIGISIGLIFVFLICNGALFLRTRLPMVGIIVNSTTMVGTTSKAAFIAFITNGQSLGIFLISMAVFLIASHLTLCLATMWELRCTSLLILVLVFDP
ncbi:uncharacterized protein LOC120184891 [Hibiscus syriacus]|uniref:uncharacterized protein LOC120184891 n=1 Tax=Hibiscus syriacus TaxID=106335 RepID=UPI001921EFCD|nr:uncharacterized protein LOC120184891 [Hibiscus syriacus]